MDPSGWRATGAGGHHRFTVGVQRDLENLCWTSAKTSSWSPIQWSVGIPRQCLCSFNENLPSVNPVLVIVLGKVDAKINEHSRVP